VFVEHPARIARSIPLPHLSSQARIEAAITPRTRAIVPVHLYGQYGRHGGDHEIAGRHGLAVVEDVAQAQGATQSGRNAGSIGDAATLSFYPTKILGGYGDGGAVLSDTEDVVAAARSLRFYGMEATYYAERHGYNSRLDEVQAAILALKLPLSENGSRSAGRSPRATTPPSPAIAFARSPKTRQQPCLSSLRGRGGGARGADRPGLKEAGIGTGIAYRGRSTPCAAMPISATGRRIFRWRCARPSGSRACHLSRARTWLRMDRVIESAVLAHG
jgi:hypothetical protein